MLSGFEPYPRWVPLYNMTYLRTKQIIGNETTVTSLSFVLNSSNGPTGHKLKSSAPNLL